MPDPNVPHATDVAQNPEHAQEPQDNDDNNNHVKDFLHPGRHGDICIDKPHNNPDDNEDDD